MRVIDPGHHYELATLDGVVTQGELVFVKRIGCKFPGNVGEPHAGTNIQEVLRALIDRVKYLDGQISSPYNQEILYHFRAAIRALEIRAAERHHRTCPPLPEEVELLPTCSTCGHLMIWHGEATPATGTYLEVKGEDGTYHKVASIDPVTLETPACRVCGKFYCQTDHS